MSLAASRVLAAVRFVDQATGSTVPTGLRIRCQNATGTQNRSGLWVIRSAAGVPQDPESVEAESVEVQAEVAGNRGYLPRSFTVDVPRAMTGNDRVYNPVDVDLPPSTASTLRHTWAAVYVQVEFDTSGESERVPVEGALVRLSEGHNDLCRSLTNNLGEAVVIAPAIPLFSPGEDDTTIIAARVSHRVRVVVDEAQTDPETGRRLTVADPDDLWRRRSSLRRSTRVLQLGSGQRATRSFVISRT